jgi:hypothetical protein
VVSLGHSSQPPPFCLTAQALYYLSSFFNQFGPNATTWLGESACMTGVFGGALNSFGDYSNRCCNASAGYGGLLEQSPCGQLVASLPFAPALLGKLPGTVSDLFPSLPSPCPQLLERSSPRTCAPQTTGLVSAGACLSCFNILDKLEQATRQRYLGTEAQYATHLMGLRDAEQCPPLCMT